MNTGLVDAVTLAGILTDVISGQVQLYVSSIPTLIGQIKSGKLRPIAVTSDKRVDDLAQVPTIAESGYKGFEAVTWFGILGPAGLPKEIVGDGLLFMLKVVGDSMIDAAICDGDWVVVRSQPAADNGDIVAAMIDGEATVKTFKRRDGHVWLMPHNEAYAPIPGDDAVVLGRVVTVLRKV